MVLHPKRKGIEQTQRLLSKWLQKMGLALKPSTTRLCHTLNPLDGQVGFADKLDSRPSDLFDQTQK